MRMSRYPVPTLKEDPSDAVVASHRLMIRAGLARKEAAGMYVYLPLGLRVLRKITDIVRQEMDAAGALEFLMPELTTADLWKESGRWEAMGPEMIRIRDRNGLEYALAPTHEEAFTGTVRSIISSYKDLPLNAYQINTKFRDEIRPRFGVIRSKEFIMKDAYSFDMDEEGLEKSYQAMRVAYRNIFKRCGLETIPVEADTGTMGGSQSEEFMVPSEIGEELLLLCDACGYRANQEKAGFKRPDAPEKEAPAERKEVATPDVKTIDDLVKFFGCGAGKFLKSIIYVADSKPVMAVIAGDRDINEHKLKGFLGAAELELAPDATVVDVTKAPVGFAGPVNDFKIRTVFDVGVKEISNGITGANRKDVHYSGVNPGRDFTIKEEADIALTVEGDACPKCAAAMKARRGIEVGHIFKLGYKYSKSMNLTVLDKNGKSVHPIMGCYGIGVNRTMATVIEQHHDGRGISWPVTVAPFSVWLVSLGKSDEEVRLSDEVYDLVRGAGIEVLYDDRKLSPGFKFGDADMVGAPVRVTVGKNYYQNGDIEVKLRSSESIDKVKKDDIVRHLKDLLAREAARFEVR
ncbi:MAG: proline--tRNA ligase [Spirochaetes bacterium]|nr:proline--tRNA ligase [Spirochaetota bacterium]